MRKARAGLIALVAVLVAVVGWHVWLVRGINADMAGAASGRGDNGDGLSVSVNPMTNRVTMTMITMPSADSSNPFASLGQSLATSMLSLAGPAMAEGLNAAARKRLDLYAMVVPYQVQVVAKEPDPATLESIRSRQAEARRVEEGKKRVELHALLKEGVRLDSVRVADGKDMFGQQAVGVFGTVANGGSRTFKGVTMRVYFLDAAGKRIGEKDFYPVAASPYSPQSNGPLRPGYRADFGFTLAGAPASWEKGIETEIVALELAN